MDTKTSYLPPQRLLDWKQRYQIDLANLYPEEEIRQITIRCFEAIGRTYAQMFVSPDERLSEEENTRLHEMLSRLKSSEPLQYILGTAPFFDLDIPVRPGVLIPRPETEEIVAFALGEQILGTGRMLDVCSGSGCIALAWKHQKPKWEVRGLEYSKNALEIARENGNKLDLFVDFIEQDVLLSWENIATESVDAVVCNPPYIPNSESSTLHSNVISFEPKEALFVEDHHPLQFYTGIAREAERVLKHGGTLYLECHKDFAQQVADYYCSFSGKTRLLQDSNGLDRLVVWQKAQD